MKIAIACVYKEDEIKNSRGAMVTPKNEIFIGL